MDGRAGAAGGVSGVAGSAGSAGAPGAPQRVMTLRAGDLVAFGLAGAYAWNISRHGFLMHPPPASRADQEAEYARLAEAGALPLA